MTATEPRPRVVTAAFWTLLVGAVLLMTGGLLAATASIPSFYRGAGIICVLGGATIGYLAGRTRTGDARFRRATLAVSLVLVVMVSLIAAFGVIHILALLSVLPLIVGTLLLSRPGSASWFNPDDKLESDV
jgi:hypothetical protein